MTKREFIQTIKEVSVEGLTHFKEKDNLKEVRDYYKNYFPMYPTFRDYLINAMVADMTPFYLEQVKIKHIPHCDKIDIVVAIDNSVGEWCDANGIE